MSHLSISFPVGFQVVDISKMLLEQGIKINHGTASNVLKWKGMKRQCDLKGIEFKRQIKSPKLTPKVLKNISKHVSRENLPAQRKIALDNGVSQRSVNRAIHHVLRMELRKKTKVHYLTGNETGRPIPENCTKMN